MTPAIDDLLEALEDVDDATREEAAKALAELGDPGTLEALLQACADDFWSVRSLAGWGVAKIGGPKAVEALIGLFNDPIMEVRNDAVVAMAKLGESTSERLIGALKDERWRVRWGNFARTKPSPRSLNCFATRRRPFVKPPAPR